MPETTVNVDVPEDCIKILQVYLEKCNKNGLFTLDDSFVIGMALRNLRSHINNSSQNTETSSSDLDAELSNIQSV